MSISGELLHEQRRIQAAKMRRAAADASPNPEAARTAGPGTPGFRFSDAGQVLAIPLEFRSAASLAAAISTLPEGERNAIMSELAARVGLPTNYIGQEA